MKEISPCRKELKVEVPRPAIEAEFEEVYGELKRVAFVPGFRVGSAPRDLLERHHGDKAREQVLRRLIRRSLGEALKAQGPLDLVGQPEVSEVKFDPPQQLSYLAHFEVSPSVPLGRYKKLKLTRPKPKIDEETITQVLSRLQEQQAQLRPVLEPRPTAEGDFLLVDLTEQVPGKPPVKRRDVVIHLDLKNDPEGVLKALVGLNPPDKRQVQLKSGHTVTVEVKQIKIKELPPLDDALAKSVGAFETLEALKEAIRQDLRRQAEASQKHALETQVAHQLVEEWAFDVPPSLVGSQAQRLLKERALDLMNQGIPPAQVEEQAKALTDQAKLEALKDVKLFFILRTIARSEQVSATEEEEQVRIQALAGRLRASEEEVRKDLETKDLMDEVRWGIIRSKVMDLIVHEAEIKEE